jgi:pimeloyl-ACP methyl ester carboxylesterase
VFDRRVETRIYNTLPHNLEQLLREHPLRCPVGFIGGTRSVESRLVGLGLTRKVAGGSETDRVRFIEGTHLFPMERPRKTAEVIAAMLVQMEENLHLPAA